MKKTYDLWKHWCKDPILKNELDGLNDDKDIYDRFYTSLSFGTGGLRGLMGVGSNRMNIYTVRQATQGIINVLKKDKNSLKAVVGYDSRNNSYVFAQEVAKVLTNNHVFVYLFDELRPTPEVSFAVRELNCDVGIVITASHNPKEYNGYKVYGNDGGQITQELASQFAQSIQTINPFEVKVSGFEDSIHNGQIVLLNQTFDDLYLNRILDLDVFKEKFNRSQRIVYTPIHGSAFKLIDKILRLNGYLDVHYVSEQIKPNGDFPTVKSPNPEEKESLNLAINLANDIKADLVLGTDPDGDRVGIAVRDNNEMVLLNGNQVGALLVNYMLENSKEVSARTAIVKTIVTSDLGKKIAESYGATVFETLTGFKYIGEKIKEFETSNTYDFLLGFEESYGYLTGTFVRDKDAVIASLLICEMFSYYKSKGVTLLDQLEELYKKFGYFQEELMSFSFKGEEGLQKNRSILSAFRNMEFLQKEFRDIHSIEDYSNSKRYFLNGKTETINLPQSDVVKVRFNDDSWFAIRPSGTEPKLKVYISSISDSNLQEIIRRYIESV